MEKKYILKIHEEHFCDVRFSVFFDRVWKNNISHCENMLFNLGYNAENLRQQNCFFSISGLPLMFFTAEFKGTVARDFFGLDFSWKPFHCRP